MRARACECLKRSGVLRAVLSERHAQLQCSVRHAEQRDVREESLIGVHFLRGEGEILAVRQSKTS